jgi:hypothetical protein
MAVKKTTDDERYELILAEIQAIKNSLAERRHIDTKVMEQGELIKGNGKPGFIAIRDKVLAWEMKLNALSVAIIIDIVIRVVTSVYRIG